MSSQNYHVCMKNDDDIVICVHVFFFHMFLDSQIPSRPSSPSTQSLEESSRPEINATYPDVYIVNC